MTICILAMKMHSYFHTNQLLAEHYHKGHHEPGSPQPSTRPGTELKSTDSFGKLLDAVDSTEDQDHTDEYPHNGKKNTILGLIDKIFISYIRGIYLFYVCPNIGI